VSPELVAGRRFVADFVYVSHTVYGPPAQSVECSHVDMAAQGHCPDRRSRKEWWQ
jgi:hypothetical protein